MPAERKGFRPPSNLEKRILGKEAHHLEPGAEGAERPDPFVNRGAGQASRPEPGDPGLGDGGAELFRSPPFSTQMMREFDERMPAGRTGLRADSLLGQGPTEPVHPRSERCWTRSEEVPRSFVAAM